MPIDHRPNQYPGLLRRGGALLYDALLVLGVLFFATAIMLPFRGGMAFSTQGWGHAIYQVYLLLAVYGFFAGFWVRGGQTLGMKAWKIRVESNSGGTVTAWQAAWRFTPVWLAASIYLPGSAIWPDASGSLALLGGGICAVDFIWALLDTDKQCLHDRIAGTRMVFTP